jgi:hypothetical protein
MQTGPKKKKKKKKKKTKEWISKRNSACLCGIFVEGFRLYTKDIYCIISNIIKNAETITEMHIF